MSAMKHIAGLLLAATVLVGCGGSKDTSVAARQTEPAKVTTRWKWTPKSMVGTPKGLVIEQSGDHVDASFYYLKDGDGFAIDKKISQGRYIAADRKIILPPAPMTPDEIDMAIKMDVGRVEVSFTPDAPVLKSRWTGQGVPAMDMDFVRVQE